jgi:L-ascorbate metabolism protein UlaG (beta-lactamase superfamily)
MAGGTLDHHGKERLTVSALTVRDLPKIDIVLLSHAHFVHFDMLHRFHRSTTVITAHRTTDLLRWKRFRDVSELRWKERKSVSTSAGKIDITAFRVKHCGARERRDTYRGYNGYVFERNNRRIIFSGDTAPSDSFAELRASGPIDLAIMPIGAYNPWIHSHCTVLLIATCCACGRQHPRARLRSPAVRPIQAPPSAMPSARKGRAVHRE